MRRAAALVLSAVVAVAAGAAPARADGVLSVRPAASAELLYNDAVELLFDESDPSTAHRGDNVDGSDAGANLMMTGSVGLGAAIDASAAVAAHPFRWLSLQIRPELFAQIFFDRKDTALVRLSAPLFVQAALHPKVTLLFASEYVANVVPYRSSFTFQRETATGRLRWTPTARLELDLESVERVKRYPERVTWGFRSHRVGADAALAAGGHVRLSAAYAVQLNSGADSIGVVQGDVGGSTAEGWQQRLAGAVRVGFGDHLIEAGYQLRLARGGDAVAAVDQPLLSPSGIVEEDSDELSLGGFDKHVVELTYDVRIGRRVIADLYGRYSRKIFSELRSLADASRLRVDDVWLVGAVVSVRVSHGVALDVRALYHVNDSTDPEYSFQNLILGVGARWEY